MYQKVVVQCVSLTNVYAIQTHFLEFATFGSVVGFAECENDY